MVLPIGSNECWLANSKISRSIEFGTFNSTKSEAAAGSFRKIALFKYLFTSAKGAKEFDKCSAILSKYSALFNFLIKSYSIKP
jgi:hypothetical protein